MTDHRKNLYDLKDAIENHFIANHKHRIDLIATIDHCLTLIPEPINYAELMSGALHSLVANDRVPTHWRVSLGTRNKLIKNLQSNYFRADRAFGLNVVIDVTVADDNIWLLTADGTRHVIKL